MENVQNLSRLMALGFMGTGIACLAVSAPHTLDGECVSDKKQAPLGMWLTVTGVTLILYSLVSLYDIQKMPEKMAAALSGDPAANKQNPLIGLIFCFWLVWFIMGNVYFFFFTTETVFDNGPSSTNSTAQDAHAKSCATLEGFGFVLLICLWTVPCVLTLCLQSMVAQATMATMKGAGSPKETETVV